ncbi:hypothetical protein GLV98_04205 [Halobacillus litoralis]|uniref:Uncharacterized protein n=1 Tax=Halobacillus litoralis TaxID=45668 RepID=A0A845E353_9BACI|nr:hypothetical protein [Halobacillus litoralis]MYL48669.1 hypothetical protein [Halobacillus litoralis]
MKQKEAKISISPDKMEAVLFIPSETEIRIEDLKKGLSKKGRDADPSSHGLHKAGEIIVRRSESYGE